MSSKRRFAPSAARPCSVCPWALVATAGVGALACGDIPLGDQPGDEAGAGATGTEEGTGGTALGGRAGGVGAAGSAGADVGLGGLTGAAGAASGGGEPRAGGSGGKPSSGGAAGATSSGGEPGAGGSGGRPTGRGGAGAAGATGSGGLLGVGGSAGVAASFTGGGWAGIAGYSGAAGTAGYGAEAGCGGDSGGAAGAAGNAGAGCGAVGSTLPACTTETPEGDRCLLDDFEGGPETEPDGWDEAVWTSNVSELAKTANPEDKCDHVLTIASLVEPNDARWERSFDLAAHAYYTLTGWIRTEEVNEGYGAHFGISGEWDACNAVTGTTGWTPCAFTIGAGASGTVLLTARLGHNGGDSSGQAWFDDLELVRLQSARGTHIRAVLEPSDAASLQTSDLDSYLVRMDRAYDTYFGLVGAAPGAGAPVDVVSIWQPAPSAQSVCGEAVCLPRERIIADVGRAAAGGAWNYGMLLGLSEFFDLDERWVWNAEFFAALKAYYVVETLDVAVMTSTDPDWTYQGSDLVEFYQGQVGDQVGIADLIVRFIEISDTIGWEPFLDAFSYFRGLSPDDVPTGYNRFDEFVDQLSLSSGTNVLQMFTTSELVYVANITEFI